MSKRDGSQGLNTLRAKGLSPSKIIGCLASGMGLVPFGSELTASELLSDLTSRGNNINKAFIV